ncbi:MAG: ATP-dependent Clp protease adaptor ClpS [Phycisphaerales bacterium]|nr:ATP-dependent Clp protease adaptor ClpS [Phycisphaerales bacterium]
MDGTKTLAKPSVKPSTKPPQWWHVILLDDDDHTYEYVIRMLQEVFAFSKERGFEIARTVDGDGRAIICTVHRELAELRQEQIHAFGRDPSMRRSKGSMSAVLEPAEGGC